MDTSEFLFPHDLEINPTKLKSVLIVGSCLSNSYKIKFEEISPETRFDHILFNNAVDLPDSPPLPIGDYDFQFVQIPIRSVLNDSVIRVLNFNASGFPQSILDAAKSNMDMLLDSALKYYKATGIISFVSNFIVPQRRAAPSFGLDFTGIDLTTIIEDLNRYLAAAVQKIKNVFIADVNSIASSVGKRYFLDDTIYFYTHGGMFFPEWREHEHFPFWTAPNLGRIQEIPPMETFYENHNNDFLDAVYRLLVHSYRVANQIDQVKLVIFDLDNTLWRGQIAEHYRAGQDKWPIIDGWPLGVWEAIQHLRWRGILTSICSKNDYETVKSHWDNVFSLPWLELDDFVCPKINWNPKAENIRDILIEIGLTPKSVVFVDDNPVEREAVKSAFPEMRVIGSNPFLTRRILLWSAETMVLNLTDESINREEMVKNQFQRNDERQALPRDAFLSGLGCKLHIRQLENSEQPEYTRSLELINKTNQFNTTGERWRSDEFGLFVNERHGQVYSFTVSDKFVNYGLVGVVITKDNSIKQFVMSCRVLGMDVEVAVIKEISELLKCNIASDSISASLIETNDNTPCREIFTKTGFLKDMNDSSLFFLSNLHKPTEAEHILIENVLVSANNFNFEKWYLNRYEDVAQAYLAGNIPSAKFHYEINGKNEGRFVPTVF